LGAKHAHERRVRTEACHKVKRLISKIEAAPPLPVVNRPCSEPGESYRKWRRDYGDSGWETAFRNRYEKEMIKRFDTHFYVGTLHQYPDTWIIVGLFYPQLREQGRLFA
jgi:hypothetical protein